MAVSETNQMSSYSVMPQEPNSSHILQFFCQRFPHIETTLPLFHSEFLHSTSSPPIRSNINTGSQMVTDSKNDLWVPQHKQNT